MLLVAIMVFSAWSIRRWWACVLAASLLAAAAGFMRGLGNEGNVYGPHGFQAADAALTFAVALAIGLLALAGFNYLDRRKARADRP